MTLKILKQEWWLDTSALPDLRWARLNVYGDHHLDVLDLDGQYHRFASEEKAKDWLREDEYEALERLILSGEVSSSLRPPMAASDLDLIPKMSARAVQVTKAVAIPVAGRSTRNRSRLNLPLLLSAIFVALIIMAIKNTETCSDVPYGMGWINKGPIPEDRKHLRCEMECCRAVPWDCRCSPYCPCHGSPNHSKR